MRSVELVFFAKYFYIFLNKMVLIKLDCQFIQIILREVRVSESTDFYLIARVDSLLFFIFCIFSCSIFVSGTRVSAQEDKASPGDQDRKFCILYLNLSNFPNLTTKYVCSRSFIASVFCILEKIQPWL